MFVVQEPVLKITDGEIVDVYDLTVKNNHEFFADGVLVHNCWDAVRYALDGIIKQHNFFDDALILDEPPDYAAGVII